MNGVDFEYDGVDFHIEIRYTAYTLQVNRLTGKPLECPCDRLAKVLRREDPCTTHSSSVIEDKDESSDLIGLHFKYLGCMYKITKVPTNRDRPIEAMCLSGAEEKEGRVFLFSNRLEVEAQVDKYLS